MSSPPFFEETLGCDQADSHLLVWIRWASRGLLPVPPLDLDEVLPSLLASLVPLDHGKFLRHVDGDVVVNPVVTTTTIACRNGQANKVLIFHKLVLLDSILNPMGEHLPNPKERMEFPGVYSLDFPKRGNQSQSLGFPQTHTSRSGL